jgi:hypothetical protein
MGFILFFVAFILYIPLTFINFICVFFIKNFKFKTINDYFYETAIDIDRFGNRNMRTLWNLILRKKNGYEFGDYRETISSVLGKNKINGTLSVMGKILCSILSFLDRNHCIKSIKDFDKLDIE